MSVNAALPSAYSARHPRLALFALTAAGVGLGIRYRAMSIERNERAQKSSDRNYYVSVDRSGGGI
ncbi:hypothetical protein VSDG_00122 [Cytospora chrysosperma]|uniref:Uncharacterized protein n=1 Tax=Cytospora chrysosperma TaxID=252740 RepID=A0A423WQW7_CYTCH|nr:hypothetical protein VSDG_00122 [Valsa sordida]